ncbi:MAG TPA: EthD domain-containing protein [Actinomycetota bacterium]|nr:EthD domain-containing protein [Actinomycetota bacterium]
MTTIQIWVQKKDDMSDEDFRSYWLEKHAPIARDGYQHLRRYEVKFVTRVPEGQQRPFDGIATLSWDDRDGFKADMASEAGAAGTEDLKAFAKSFGLLFVEEESVV